MLKPSLQSRNYITIEQDKLDEMNNHISELHSILIHHFDELPYHVQRKLGGYFWSNYEQQQKEKEMPSDWSLGLE